MIHNIPSPDDFYESGRELLDFAWDTVARLLIRLDDAAYFDVDTKAVSDEYWAASKRSLTTALAITQQGIEFILKGKIAEVSPYLLLSDSPQKWPSPYTKNQINYSDFRIVDAQDLIRVHDTFVVTPLPAEFVSEYKSLREKRNTIMHSVNKNLNVHVSEVVESILSTSHVLFPKDAWSGIRAKFLESCPDSVLGAEDILPNVLCHEISLVIDLLPPSKVKKYFNVDKKQHGYFCPECLNNANSHFDFEYRLAVLESKSPVETKLYCPVCAKSYQVERRKCKKASCLGGVIATGDCDHRCLTCGEYC